MKKDQASLYIPLYLSILLVLIAFSCANPVSPQGGPKDELPPKVENSEPANYSTNFEGEQIQIFFNEYVVLKNINQELLISPPFEEKPDITLKGKSVLIKLNEALDSTTTYSFFFGDAIVDLNEGNAVKGYQFLFSTGDAIDSLEFEGYLYDAYTAEPQADLPIMLYRDIYDSVPMLERPSYLSKTNDKGKFRFTNLSGGDYKIFALKDGNGNFLYDLPNEFIAFSDTTITPYFNPRSKRKTFTVQPENIHDHDHETDSTELVINENIDTLNNTLDTIPIMDSLQLAIEDSIARANIVKLPEAINLYMFQEIDSTQKVSEILNYLNRKLSIYFKFPTDSISFNVLNKEVEANWLDPIWSIKKDSVDLWFANYEGDSLSIEIMDKGLVLDTIDFSFVNLTDDREDTLLHFKPNMKRKIDFHKDLIFKFDHPVAKVIDSSFYFIEAEDTTSITLEKFDTIGLKYGIKREWQQEANYEILFPDSAFIDIYGQYSDSTYFKFKASSIEEYTSIKLQYTTSFEGANHIFHLLDAKGNLLIEKQQRNDSIVEFDFLEVAKYNVKVIIDENGNGQWDTGNYLEKKQPESIMLFSKTLEGMANWKLEEKWEIKKP